MLQRKKGERVGGRWCLCAPCLDITSLFVASSEHGMMCLIERQETTAARTTASLFLSCKHGQGQGGPLSGIYSVTLLHFLYIFSFLPLFICLSGVPIWPHC